MIFATILSLCMSANYSDCNDYIVDVATTSKDCNINLVSHSKRMANVWSLDNGKALDVFLKEFHIVEQVEDIASYDYTCQPIADKDVP
jgi:hypothetical protein